MCTGSSLSASLHHYLCLLLVTLCLCFPAVALRPCLSPGQHEGVQQIDCSWTAAAGAVSLVGAPGSDPPGPPAVVKASSGAAGAAGPSSVHLVHVILVGFKLPSPSSPQGLVPSGLLGAAAQGSTHSLSLQDVRILVDAATLQQHLKFFSSTPNVTTYTDGRSFLHVNYYADGSVSWKSVGLLLADSLEDARSTSQAEAIPPGNLTRNSLNSLSSSSMDSTNSSSSSRGRMLKALPAATPASTGMSSSSGSQQAGKPRYNYVLAANQDTIVQHIWHMGAVGGPTACLIYLEANVTLSKPPVPTGGIPMARPMAIVGLSHWNTSIDWHMQVNQILMNYRWSNISFDSVAIENLGVGDAKSAELAKPLSVSSGNNFWSLYYNRSEDRLFLKNCTTVFGSQADLDYYMFWATVYHSKLPYFKTQAKFIQDTIKIYHWKVGWQTDTSIEVIITLSASCRVADCVYQLAPVVAPRMPLPAYLGPELRTSEKSALVTAVGDPSAFQEQLRPLSGSETGRAHVILLRSNITLQPLFAAPADPNSRSSTNGSSPAADGTFVPPGMPTAGVSVTAPLSIVGDLSQKGDGPYGDIYLDFSYARGLMAVPADENNGQNNQMQVQHLRLRGLAQGPRAASASSLDSPDAWTLLGWAFRRSESDDVMLSGCTLELPPPEFDRLADLARAGGGHVVLRLSGDVRSSGGDGLVVLTGVLDGPPTSNRRRLLSRLTTSGSRRLLAQDSKALWVESLSAQGLSGSKLVLVPSDASENPPWGYFWPGGAAPVDARGGLSGSALAAAVAVPVVLVSVLAAAAAFVLLRRRKRRRQQQLMDKDVSGSGVERRFSSRSTRSSSYGSDNAMDNKCAAYIPQSGRCCSIDEEHPQQSGSGNAAVAVSSVRTSSDVAVGQDQAALTALAVCSSKGVAGAVGSGTAAALSGPVNSQGDSAQSVNIATSESSQQEEPLWLSHRLTSAISHLQQDITRRRIGGSQQQQQQQQQLVGAEKRGSSGQNLPAAAATPTAASEAATTNADSSRETAAATPTAAAPSERRGCSLVASRSPAMAESAAAIADGAAPAELQILTLIGRGSFASVFRAIWRGRCVALKVVQLPAVAGGDAGDDELSNALQTRERMAVMEAVVSVTMSHPNVVQVYTFALQPLFQQGMSVDRPQLQQQAGGSPPSNSSQQPVGWELQLIMEYCEEGSLRSALNQQRLVDPASPYRLPAVHLVLALAHDVACAMLHLHSEQIVHSDLKASNVLLTKANTFAPFTAALESSDHEANSSNSSARSKPDSCAVLLAAAQALAGGRLVAKVADFGLSLALDPESTHISHMHAGTLTHMAPELLLHGRASKASDVYAFGILLWELLTGLRAFQGMPVALVGHNVTQLGQRPPWVPGVSAPLRQLVEDCWAQDPDNRPSFSSVLQRLEQMLQMSPTELTVPLPGTDIRASTRHMPAAGAAAATVAAAQGQLSPGQELRQQWEQLQHKRKQQTQAGQQQAGADGNEIQVAGAAAAAAAAGLAGNGPEDAACVTGDWTM